MGISAASLTKAAKPGQFVTIRCGESSSPLLRRPFCFHRINSSGFEILYEVLGKGTRVLSNIKPGDKINILGPLGNGFAVPQNGKDVIIIAGGIGVAPLVALFDLLARNKRTNIYVIVGARSKGDLLCREDFKISRVKTFFATDDGSYGVKGFATDLLDKLLVEIGVSLPTIFACGPEAMLKKVAHISRKRGLDCYASLEENIACGVGACLGCAIRTKSGYKLVCKDGPVFNLNEIIW